MKVPNLLILGDFVRNSVKMAKGLWIPVTRGMPSLHLTASFPSCSIFPIHGHFALVQFNDDTEVEEPGLCVSLSVGSFLLTQGRS